MVLEFSQRLIIRIAMIILCLVFSLSLWIAQPAMAAEPNPPAQLKLLAPPTLRIDESSKTGSVLIYLQNNADKSVFISLSAEDFKSQTTGKKLGAIVQFSDPNEEGLKTIYEKEIGPQKTETVKVHVSNLWEAGESVSKLLNNGEIIGTLTALNYKPPFSVKLIFETPDNPVLSFVRNKRSTLVFKNDDPMTYPVQWELKVAGTPYSKNSVTVNPGSTASATFMPPKAWFKAWFSGLFKKEVCNGLLTLRFQPPGSTADPNWPVKTIPIKVHLSYWTETMQQWGNVIIFGALALGGICSLILSHWIPNQRRRFDLKEQLSTLAIKTREISSQIDSSLRVSVRVERNRLFKMLFSRWALNPDIGTVFTECSKGIETLDKRIRLLEEIDSAFDLLNTYYTSETAPFLIEKIENELQVAAQLLKNTEPQESDLKTAQDLVNKAISAMDKLNQTNEKFAKELANRVQKLLTPFSENGDVGSTDKCKKIRSKLPGPFEVLNQKWADSKNISRDRYLWLDTNISKLDLIQQYVWLYKNSTVTERRKCLEEHENDLLNYMNQQSWDSLRSARLLLRQMKEDIWSKDVLKEITAQHPGLSIEMDPELVRANLPVRLKACFHRKELNRSAARNKFTCVWDFGHNNLREKGWAVSHYFPEKGTYKLKAWFEDSNGHPIKAGGSGDQITLKKEIEVTPDKSLKSKDRFYVEALRLSIILIATLFGLMAGAREEILKLDISAGLIAVFLLGFGADTIKNLLTQRQQ